jgi:uncharacterized protein (DUF2141 family)
MKLIFSIISLLLFINPQNNNHLLTVSVKGLKPLKGDLYVGLHNRPEYFQVADSAFLKQKIAVNEETETVIFKNIPAGKYAVAIYHDENLNGIMDANENGFPKEGYGFSTKSKMLGRPKFEQAAFEIGSNDTITVKMIYHAVPGTKKDSIK